MATNSPPSRRGWSKSDDHPDVRAAAAPFASAPASRSFASGVDTLSEMPIKDCRIVIEAGELRPRIAAAQVLRARQTCRVQLAGYPRPADEANPSETDRR